MEKKVPGNAETQKTISLISPIVPLNILCYYIRLSLSFHGQSVEAFNHHNNLHMCLPFEVVEWSQDDMVRLIYSSTTTPLNRKNALPMSDLKVVKSIKEEEK